MNQRPRPLYKSPEHHTVKEVLTSLRDWEKIHQPWEKGGVFNQFMFVMQGTTDPVKKEAALVPLSTAVEKSAGKPFFLMPHALDQMLARINMRRQDYDRLSDNLKISVVNWYVQNPLSRSEDDRHISLRIQDGNMARAMVSARYENVDNADVIEMLMPFTEDSLVREEHRDDNTFHLSVSFPKTAKAIRVGDVVEQGIHISNSEVGLRSITVASYVLVLKCMNGAVGGGDDGSFIRFRHIGDRGRIFEAVRSEIESVKLNSEGLVAKMQLALNKSIADPAAVIENLAKDNQLTQEQFKAALDALIGDPDAHTLYGVSNAITSAAHGFTGDDKWSMQQVGANVLSLDVGKPIIVNSQVNPFTL